MAEIPPSDMHIQDDSKLKVVHIISGDLWAGAEAMAFNLIECLKEFQDLEQSVIILNEGVLADRLREIGIDVLVVDESKIPLRKIIANICSFCRKLRPDIIHSHRYKENFLAFLVTLFQRRVKLVSTQHGLPEMYSIGTDILHRFKMKFNFSILSRFFTTVAVSHDIHKFLLDNCGFSDNKLEVIHNGIAISEPKPIKKNTRSFTIGSSGRLFPVKDFTLMIEAARRVSDTGAKDVSFELAGDGPEMQKLVNLVKQLGLTSSFLLRGHQNDMEAFYGGLDLYVNTSIHEGIPMTILEALSHGLPVVAPAVGGMIEIIEDGRDGFLVTGRNPRDFAEKCLLLRNDPGLHSRMSAAAREKAEKVFSARVMAERYYGLYRKVM